MLNRRMILAFLLCPLLFILCFFPFSIAGENGKDSRENVENAAQKEWQKELRSLVPKAGAGDPEAQYEVGKHFDFGWGVKQDGFEAARWYEKAAEQGHVEAQVSLGNLYAGAYFGYLRNERKAYHWYLKAAEKSDPFAQTMVGEAYEKGVVIPRNYSTAAKWYKHAIKGGYFLAPYHLARLYANGMGFEQDLIQAYAWNALSASTGNLMALSFQEKLEAQMDQSEINRAQELAAALYKKYGNRIEKEFRR